MAKYYGLGGLRKGKVGNEKYYLRSNKNFIQEAAKYIPVNSNWLTKEEFKNYILSLLDKGIPQIYVLNELPEDLFPYALIFVQNAGETSIYVDKEGIRTKINVEGSSYDAVDVVDSLPSNRNGENSLRNNTIYFVKNTTNDNTYKIYVYEDNTLKEINVGGEVPEPENKIVTIDFDNVAIYNNSLLPSFTLEKVQSVFGNLLQGKQVELKITTTHDGADFNVSYNIYNFTSAKKTISGLLLHTMKAFFSATNYYKSKNFRAWCLNYTLPDTYEITPAENDIFDDIYPVGSIALGAKPTIGTWEKIAENKTLWGSSSTLNPGTTLEAGLPNITGEAHWFNRTQDTTGASSRVLEEYCSGALSPSTSTANRYIQADSSYSSQNIFPNGIKLDASNFNPIYGKSNTVQPPAYVVDMWIRVA